MWNDPDDRVSACLGNFQEVVEPEFFCHLDRHGSRSGDCRNGSPQGGAQRNQPGASESTPVERAAGEANLSAKEKFSFKGLQWKSHADIPTAAVRISLRPKRRYPEESSRRSGHRKGSNRFGRNRSSGIF